jgi:sec-independent protein translocase protein TatA
MQIAEIASIEVILIVVAVGLVVFGSSKIPKIARGLGSAKSEFEKGIKEGQGQSQPAVQAEDKNQTDTPAN